MILKQWNHYDFFRKVIVALFMSLFFFKSATTQYFNPDTSVITHHKAFLRGKNFPYKVTAGTLPVRDDHGKTIAGVFYTYYERSDAKDYASRPLVFFFNGGPGSSSCWLHLGGYGSPVVANMDDDGYPIQPFGTTNNEYSILDMADLVYVDPVETGYSRIVDHAISNDSMFFSDIGDTKYLAEWIRTFITRQNRWLSPKFLLGESFGTLRVERIAYHLQTNEKIYVNGVVLVSGGSGDLLGNSIDNTLRLPYYTESAWYNNLLDADLQRKDIAEVSKAAKLFTYKKLLPAIMKIGWLDSGKKKNLADSIAYYTSLPTNLILQENLLIDTVVYYREISQAYPNFKSPPNEYINPDIRWYNGIDLLSIAAIAQYHKLLAPELQTKKIDDFMEEVQEFAINEYIPGLCFGNSLDSLIKNELAGKIAAYTGIDKADILKRDLIFLRELFDSSLYRRKGYYVGGYDARYRSIYLVPLDMASVAHAFTPAVNHYFRNALKYKTDLNYYMLKSPAKWIRENDESMNPDCGIRMAMDQNPFMHVLAQSGCYEVGSMIQMFQMWQLDPAGKLKERIRFKYYPSGHMMYVHRGVRADVNKDLRQFILKSWPKPGQPAKY